MRQSTGNRRKYPTVPRGKPIRRPGPQGRRPQRTIPWLWLGIGGLFALVAMVLLLWRPWQERGASEMPTPQASDTVEGQVTQSSAITGTMTPGSVEPTLTQAPSTVATEASSAFDAPRLARLMLDLINRDRAANGLDPVAWDAVAAKAGMAHAEDMAALGYMSHWNVDGLGPDHRYAAAGGLDMAQENVYSYRSWMSDGGAAPITDWDKVVVDAQEALMGSEGHRANILSPEHTHVGVGFAYNAATGDVRIAQEFVNHYVQVSPLPRRARPGDRLVLRGKLLAGSSNPVINLAYEPKPQPLTLEQLNATSTYQSPANMVEVISVTPGDDGTFVGEIPLAASIPAGLYHVRMWVDHGTFTSVQAVNLVVSVE